MTAAVVLGMAMQYAMENELTAEEARISGQYVRMLMKRVDDEVENTGKCFRNGDANMESGAH